MTENEYLFKILEDQCLADDSDEMKALRRHREDVEKFLREKFPGCSFTIRYGGSKAKGTLIRESYDLDLIVYVHADEGGLGETLEDIYKNVAAALRDRYQVVEKTSAIRLRSKERDTLGIDFHIDVVPGRYTDGTKTDCYLHQNGGSKSRLKTNLDKHIDHVKSCGALDAVCLLKLLRVRRDIAIKQFVWELMGIDLLAPHKKRGLADQLQAALRTIADAQVPPKVEDPANPAGNDLSGEVDRAWNDLKSVARATIKQVEAGGWKAVFGPVPGLPKAGQAARVSSAVASVVAPTRPWSPQG